MFQTLKKMFGGKKEAAEVLSPVSGSVVPLSEVNDPAFAQEILGKGVAVKPSEGEFRAPLSGEVTVMFDTGHAVSIRGDNGAEVIVHIGLDTVHDKRMNDCLPPILFSAIFKLLKVLPDTELDAC